MEQLPNRIQGEFQGGFLWQDELVFGQCDLHLQVKMSTLLEHLVTSASQHCRSFGMTYESFLANDIAFVMTRATLTIHKLPRCFQHISVQTWIDGIKGPYYQRVTQWRDSENQLLVSGRSDWVLMQPSSRNFCKPNKEDSRFSVKSPVDLPPCQRIKTTGLCLEEIGSHCVQWSQIDGNHHLHSAKYADIMWDFLPEHLQSQTPSSFSIEFQKEVCLGDDLCLLGLETEGNIYYIVGETAKNPCFKVCIQF